MSIVQLIDLGIPPRHDWVAIWQALATADSQIGHVTDEEFMAGVERPHIHQPQIVVRILLERDDDSLTKISGRVGKEHANGNLLWCKR